MFDDGGMKQYSDLASEQLDCIEFMALGEDSLICADVGTGKTVMCLTAMVDALRAYEVDRWLVLAPKLVATDTWAVEPGEWAHLDSSFHNLVAIACGNEKERIAAIESDAKIVLMNYENMSWLLARYPKHPKRGDCLPFDGLVCDEIDKLKDVSSKRFKDFRNRVGIFNKRIGLTGTLLPNDLTEVWGQTYLLDEGDAFGRSFYKWRRENFYPTDYEQHNWAPHPGTKEKIIASLRDLVYRLPAKGLPEVVMVEPSRRTLPPKVRAVYKQLSKDFYIELEGLSDTTHEVEALNSAVLSGKLMQICAGFSYVDGTKEAVWHSKERFVWLDELLDTLQGKQVLIFYHFNEERMELLRRYPGTPYLGQGVSDSKARAHIAAWNAGRLPYLALHPQSAGHGLNLQKSGAHHIAFLTLPFSGGMLKQVTGRLARRGQAASEIFVHTCLMRDTVDERVHEVVTTKLNHMEEFLGDLHDATRT